MERELASVGLTTGLDPTRPRLTPAVITYYDLLVKYLMEGFQDRDRDALSSSHMRIKQMLVPEVNVNFDASNGYNDTADLLRLSLVQFLSQRCTEARRYGLSDLYDNAIDPSSLNNFLATLLFSVNRIYLKGGPIPRLSENTPVAYNVGRTMTVLPGSVDSFHFAAGACLAQRITESTTGPLNYAVCLNGVLLWWNTDLAHRPGLDDDKEDHTYILVFEDDAREVLSGVFENFYGHIYSTSVPRSMVDLLWNKHIVFQSLYYLQGLMSLYKSNDSRIDVNTWKIGGNKLIWGVIKGEGLNQNAPRWSKVRVSF